MPRHLFKPCKTQLLQFEEAAKRVSQRLQSQKEDGSEPDMKDVQVMLHKEKVDGPLGAYLSMRDVKVGQSAVSSRWR